MCVNLVCELFQRCNLCFSPSTYVQTDQHADLWDCLHWSLCVKHRSTVWFIGDWSTWFISVSNRFVCSQDPQKKLRWFRSTRFLIAIQPVIASDSHEMGHPPFWPNVQQTIFSIPVWHVPAQAGQYGVRPPHGFFGPTELASGCGLKNRVPMDGATTKWVRFIILPLNCH